MTFEPLFRLLGFQLLAMLAWMTILWAAHFRLRNAGIVDFGWASGLGILAVWDAIVGPGYVPRKVFIAIMVGVWSLRLAGHVLFDRVLGKPEDPRYTQLRDSWREGLALKLFLFFLLQGALDVLLSFPFLLMAFNPSPQWHATEWAALALWGIAITGEWIADHQLKMFKRQRTGKTCRVGLWRYSRHPNYFFEWLIWMAYALAATASPWGGLSWLCPFLMLYFLFKVTGIPLTEEQAIRTKGDDYREYQRTTSVFIPWFPKKGSNA